MKRPNYERNPEWSQGTPWEKAGALLERRRARGLANFDEAPDPKPRTEKCRACGQEIFVRRVFVPESGLSYSEIASLHFAGCGLVCAGNPVPAELPPKPPREGFHVCHDDDDWTDGCSKCGHPDEERP